MKHKSGFADLIFAVLLRRRLLRGNFFVKE